MSNILNSMTHSAWLNSLLILIFAYTIVYIHELGHAFFVKRAGLDVNKLELGIGPHLTFGKVSLGLIPAGKTKFNSDNLNYETANTDTLLICLGGIIAQSLLEVVLLPFIANSIVKGFLLVNIIFILCNLLPYKERRISASDGYKAIVILKVIFNKQNVLEM